MPLGNLPFEKLEEAFGPSSLGILIIQDLPSKFLILRQRLLSYSSYLANLPQPALESLSNPTAKYLVGWSHGKETLKSGHYDTLKGSFYVNCAFYQDPTLQSAPDAESPTFPEYTAPNIWPPESLLPGFKETFTELCSLVIDTAVLVAKACDRYATANIPDYGEGYLEHVVKTSLTTKARLLHYFPPEPGPQSSGVETSMPEDEDSWCATHLDHGCLTGLTSALYVDESAHPPQLPHPPLPSPSSTENASASSSTSLKLPLPSLPSSPDPEAGLYIRSRTGVTTKVNIPADCLAFQTGEALELITKGKFRAVPHFVKGPKASGTDGAKIARNTLAVFTQPNLGAVVDIERGTTFAEFARGVVARHSQ